MLTLEKSPQWFSGTKNVEGRRMDEMKGVDLSDLDQFEVQEAAVLQKKEDLRKLLALRDSHLKLLATRSMPALIDRVMECVKAAVDGKQLSCRITHKESPYTAEGERQRLIYLSLQAVIEMLEKEPYNFTVCEHHKDNTLEILRANDDVRNIEIEYTWDISCLLVNV